MPISSAVPTKLIALALTTAALGLGLTKYTAPIHGGPAYATLRGFIAHALGDSGPTLPGPPATLHLDPAPTPDLGGRNASPSSSGTGSLDLSQADRWVAGVAAQDSAALRAWLGVAVLPTTVVRGDTVMTSLLRLTLHRGCPILSRLTALSVGQVSQNPRLASVTADCPRLADVPTTIEPR